MEEVQKKHPKKVKEVKEIGLVKIEVGKFVIDF